MVSASAALAPKAHPSLFPFFSSFSYAFPSFFRLTVHSWDSACPTSARPLLSPSFVLKDDRRQVITAFDRDEIEDEDTREGRETLLYSFAPLPSLLVAALPGGNLIHPIPFNFLFSVGACFPLFCVCCFCFLCCGVSSIRTHSWLLELL